MPAPNDVDRAVEQLRKHLGNSALKPIKPPTSERKTISATLSISAHDGLRALAQRLGYVHGGHGNVSMLLEAIGTGTLDVMPIVWNPARHYRQD